MYAAVNIWRLNERGATGDNRLAIEVADRLRTQPGFVAYTLVRTGKQP